MCKYHENFIKILLNPYTPGEVIIDIKYKFQVIYIFK